MDENRIEIITDEEAHNDAVKYRNMKKRRNEKQKEYYKRNPDVFKDARKRYYEKNREEIKEKQRDDSKRYYEQNKDRINRRRAEKRMEKMLNY